MGLVLSMLCAALVSCATVLEGSHQTVRLHVQPSGSVAALVNGEPASFKAGELQLDKGRDAHFVTLSKPGYNSATLAFNREINPFWPVANLIWLIAAPIGWFVDWYTASVYRIDPRDVHVILQPAEAPENEG